VEQTAESTYHLTKTIDLNPGDYVIFYTDGITDAMNQAEDLYGFDRLGKAIKNAKSNISSDEMIHHIMQDIRFFVGNAEQFDDMTVVVLRYIGL
jgi:phosphoserine phosphatase RsbU/P